MNDTLTGWVIMMPRKCAEKTCPTYIQHTSLLKETSPSVTIIDIFIGICYSRYKLFS